MILNSHSTVNSMPLGPVPVKQFTTASCQGREIPGGSVLGTTLVCSTVFGGLYTKSGNPK